MKLALLVAMVLTGLVLATNGQFDDDFDPDMMDDDMMGDDMMDEGMMGYDDDDAAVEPEDDDTDYSEPEPVSIPREERPVYQTPKLTGSYHFLETFETEELDKK